MLKKLLNISEEKTHQILTDICDKYGANIFSKVRVADVFPIQSDNVPKNHFQYALQSHFDFVVSDSDNNPLFSIEFDGPSHKTKKAFERDKKKNNLCKIFNFPILRINTKYLDNKYRQYDLLSWFVEAWFAQKQIYAAQEKGYLPLDEPFDPFSFITLPERKKTFPMWLSIEKRSEIEKLYNNKEIADFAPSEWIGTDKDGNYYGIIWIAIDNNVGVYCQTGMKCQLFPIIQSEILSELLLFQLFDQLKITLEKKDNPIPLKDIYKIVDNFKDKYKLALFCGLGKEKK